VAPYVKNHKIVNIIQIVDSSPITMVVDQDKKQTSHIKDSFNTNRTEVDSVSEPVKTNNDSYCYLSGQTRKRNIVEGEKADTSIINMTEFKRNALKLVLHGFQFIP
jgi:hypothetical protein